jgi:hypothetical protein
LKKLFLLFSTFLISIFLFSSEIRNIEYSNDNVISIRFSRNYKNYEKKLIFENPHYSEIPIEERNIEFEIDENKVYTISVFSEDKNLEKKSFFLAKNLSENITFEDDEKSVMFFSETFDKNSETFVLINYENDLIISAEIIIFCNEGFINKFIFPIGIKDKTGTIKNYLKVNTFLKREMMAAVSAENYFPIISNKFIKSEYDLIFPSLLNVLPAIIISKDFVEVITFDLDLKLSNTKSLEKYSQLWKIKLKKQITFANRFIPLVFKDFNTPFFSYKQPELNVQEEKVTKKNKNAVIFVHGMHPHYPEGLFELESFWKKNKTKSYWNDWFRYIQNEKEKFEKYDFYEFIYDSNSKTFYEFAEDLSNLMKKGSFHEYESIYFISHSMGALVARQSANYFGYDNIKKIISLNGANEGAVLQNLIEILGFFSGSKENNYNYDDFFNEIASIFLYKDVKLEETVCLFLKEYPQLIPALIFEISALSPFSGGYSVRHQDKSLLKELEKFYENSVSSIFTYNEEIKALNENDKYIDKTVFISSYIENNFDSKYFIFMSILESLFKDTEKIEYINDGILRLESQFLEKEKHNFEVFENINHSELLDNEEFIEIIFTNYILK